LWEKERTRATERKERARISPKAPVETETVKGAASATEENRAVVLSLRVEKVKATIVRDPLLGTGRQRFAECIFWVSVKLVTVAVAFTTRRAASSRKELAPRARIVCFRTISLLLPPPRATRNLRTARTARSARLEAEARTRAGHEARLQDQSAAFVAQDPGKPETASDANSYSRHARRREGSNLKKRKKRMMTNLSATCWARLLQTVA
jgi:hypothetical protein